MEILVRGLKPKLVTRLLPISHFYSSSSSSSSRVSPSLSSSSSSADASPSFKRFKSVTDPKAVLDRPENSSPSASSSSEGEGSLLWKRIRSVTDSKASLVPVLDGWIREGNTVEVPLLRSLISLLQREKRHNHALEISNELCYKECIPSDVAIRARLFQKTCGLVEHVEAYFNNLFDHRKTYYDYVTLLCYYVKENYVEKAEAVMRKMREKGIIQEERSIFPYNLLMKLYSRKGDIKKMNTLLQEMERDKIRPDKHTMEAFIAAPHISGMGKVLDQIGLKDDKSLLEFNEEWPTYLSAVNGYLKFGLIEPALTVLRKMETIIPKSSSGFQFILNLYVKIGIKDELYRVWNKYKHLVCLDDKIFGFMISSVLKMRDVKGAERIAEEWDSKCAEPSGLWKRIKDVKDPSTSVVPVLDEWICEGNFVGEPLLRSLIGLLCRYRRCNHAAEISQWMRDCHYATLSPSCSGAAVRLRVIYRTRGLEHAETYFKELRERDFSMISDRVYYALLCCYVEENSVHKAEAIMEEMREKGMAKSPYPYDLLISLCTKNNDFDKINILIQEMETNGICPDKYTMSYLMAAYVAASNISGMEKILNHINKDPQLLDGWRTYATAANGYLKLGLVEPALTVLRKVEKMMRLGRCTVDFDCLLTLYAKTGRKDELFRVWNKYKSLVVLNDETFSCMLSSVLKLEDIAGAERIFEELESGCTKYCSELLNKLLVAYCKKGLFKKAEAAVAKALKQRKLYANTYTVLAGGYLDQKRMTKAIEMFKRAVFVSSKEWKPNLVVLNACFDYLEAQGDTQTMEEIIKSFKSKELLTRDMYHRLVRTYVATGKVECLDRSLMDGFPADEEINKILEAK